MIFKIEVIIDACERKIKELEQISDIILKHIVDKENSGIKGFFRKMFRCPFTEEKFWSNGRYSMPDDLWGVRGETAYCKSIKHTTERFRDVGVEELEMDTEVREMIGLWAGDCLSCKHYIDWDGKEKRCWYVVPKAGAGWTCCEWREK